jgi:hypothetical protein
MPEWTSVADNYLHPSTPPVMSVSPVTLTVPGRPLDLEVRVSAPVTGTDLPIVPQLAGRINRGKVAVAGHSLGSFTGELLLGARVTDPETDEEVNLLDPRITQGVLLGAIGRGGDAFNGFRSAYVPIFRTTDLTTMVTPTLVIAGDKDDSQHWTTMGPDWHADPYHLAPVPKTLLTVFDGGHLLGGIQGHDSVETTDESPDRVAAIAELTAAYLRTAFNPDDNSWRTAQDTLTTGPGAFGRVESK